MRLAQRQFVTGDPHTKQLVAYDCSSNVGPPNHLMRLKGHLRQLLAKPSTLHTAKTVDTNTVATPDGNNT